MKDLPYDLHFETLASEPRENHYTVPKSLRLATYFHIRRNNNRARRRTTGLGHSAAVAAKIGD